MVRFKNSKMVRFKNSKLSLLILIVLLFTFTIIISESVLALKNCTVVETFNPPAGYTLMGYVSMQGHYSNELLAGKVAYPYGLFCDDKLVQTRPDSVPTVNFSDPTKFFTDPFFGAIYGGGHITTTGVGVLFEGEARQGFTAGQCRVAEDGANCDAQEVCVLKVSNKHQGTVADCTNNTMPLLNNFQNKICCKSTEYCRDGIDNTGDGLIDCASPDCHPANVLTDVPKRCDPLPYPGGNIQSTNECVSLDGSGNKVVSPHCIYTDAFGLDTTYYCSYGQADSFTINGMGDGYNEEGYCCPQGMWYNSVSQRCQTFTQCGIDSADWCGFNFINNRTNWINSIYDGATFSSFLPYQPLWCHSQVQLFRSGTSRSEACCPVVTHGTFGYYIIDSNVKIFGYE